MREVAAGGEGLGGARIEGLRMDLGAEVEQALRLARLVSTKVRWR